MVNRYLITHSLLQSWLYLMRSSSYEPATEEKDPMVEFLSILRREPSETTRKMQDGIDFEDLVTQIIKSPQGTVIGATEPINGEVEPIFLEDHPWYQPAKVIADLIDGGVLQYKASKQMTVRGIDILLYGRLDALRAGKIYDIKFSKSYEKGKYIESTQHPIYFELIPEASKFQYLISNGTYVWVETYRREEAQDIRPIISDFFDWLDTMDLMDVYKKHWQTIK